MIGLFLEYNYTMLGYYYDLVTKVRRIAWIAEVVHEIGEYVVTDCTSYPRLIVRDYNITNVTLLKIFIIPVMKVMKGTYFVIWTVMLFWFS